MFRVELLGIEDDDAVLIGPELFASVLIEGVIHGVVFTNLIR